MRSPDRVEPRHPARPGRVVHRGRGRRRPATPPMAVLAVEEAGNGGEQRGRAPAPTRRDSRRSTPGSRRWSTTSRSRRRRSTSLTTWSTATSSRLPFDRTELQGTAVRRRWCWSCRRRALQDLARHHLRSISDLVGDSGEHRPRPRRARGRGRCSDRASCTGFVAWRFRIFASGSPRASSCCSAAGSSGGSPSSA